MSLVPLEITYNIVSLFSEGFCRRKVGHPKGGWTILNYENYNLVSYIIYKKRLFLIPSQMFE